MARTTGPLGSQQAHGTIAGQMTFANWKGRTYVRTTPRKAREKTPLQISSRAMMTFLSSRWSQDVSAADQATWADLASASNVTPFNAYTKENLQRWGNFVAPTQVYPSDDTGLFPFVAPTPTATGQVGQALITWTVVAPNDGWALMIHRSTTSGFTPNRATLIGVAPIGPVGVNTFLDRPVQPGTYFWTAIVSLEHGKLIGPYAESSATVT